MHLLSPRKTCKPFASFRGRYCLWLIRAIRREDRTFHSQTTGSRRFAIARRVSSVLEVSFSPTQTKNKLTSRYFFFLVELIDPEKVAYVFVSPRQRAHRTFDLLFEDCPERPRYELTEEVREWDYGDWEGLTPSEILERRSGWFIWDDG